MDPFYQNILTSILGWIGYDIHYEVWDEITYPFTNFNGATVEVWEWINDFVSYSTGMWLLIHAGIKIDPCYLKGPEVELVLFTHMLLTTIIYTNLPRQKLRKNTATQGT